MNFVFGKKLLAYKLPKNFLIESTSNEKIFVLTILHNYRWR
jgi:hypothetical protein